MCLIGVLGVTMDDEHLQEHMEVSKKMVGTLKSSIQLGVSPSSHAAIGGTPIYGTAHMNLSSGKLT